MLKYEEIIEYIISEISVGNLTYMKKLPSIRAISKIFDCSAGTVIRAYDKLEDNHVIYSSPKSGYYVLMNSQNTNISQDSLIDFSSGVPNVETFPYKSFQHCLNESIEFYKETLFSYSDPRGLNSLINVLSKHLQQYQIFTKPKNIIVTSSSQQALNILSLMPFPNEKCNVLVEQPTYYGIIKFLELNNIPTLGIERGFNGINLDELENIFKYGDIKFFYTIPRFHNPTGTSFSKQEKQAIVKMAEKYDVYILEDDIAVDLDADKKNDPMFSYDISSKVIYLKSYSKILMPGLRVAAVVLPEALIDTFLNYKNWTDMNSPILSQGALEIYLNNGMFDIHKKEVVKLYSDRLKILRKMFSKLPEGVLKWNVPHSGYFACIYAKNSLPSNKIVNLLEQQHIELFDTSQCFLRKYKNYDYYRISISKTSKEKIERGIPKVLSAIQSII